jgi:addiction module HigA family antidote
MTIQYAFSKSLQNSTINPRRTLSTNTQLINTDKLKFIYPGEILLEEFLQPMNLSQNKLALAIRVPARRINEIVQEKRRITADTALRLARYFNMSPRFWLGLQMDYDLDLAEDEIGEKLQQEVTTFNLDNVAV